MKFRRENGGRQNYEGLERWENGMLDQNILQSYMIFFKKLFIIILI